MTEHLSLFEDWTDEQLGDAACAFDSAAGEGAFGNVELAQMLVDEANRRGMRLPFAYGGDAKADEWIRNHFDA